MIVIDTPWWIHRRFRWISKGFRQSSILAGSGYCGYPFPVKFCGHTLFWLYLLQESPKDIAKKMAKEVKEYENR